MCRMGWVYKVNKITIRKSHQEAIPAEKWKKNVLD